MLFFKETLCIVILIIVLLILAFLTEDAAAASFTNRSKSCDQAMAPGICRDRLLRYAYDKTTGNCVSFFYTGCASTLNNFLTYEECRRDCVINERY